MAYDSTTKIIKAPVSIYDIANLFQVLLKKTVSGAVQTKYSMDDGTIIKSSVGDTIDGWTVDSRAEINKWAKFKPVNLMTGISPMTPVKDTYGQLNHSSSDHSQWAWKNDATWWRGKNGMCGLSIHQYSNLNDLLFDYFAPHDIGYTSYWNWGYDKVDSLNFARLIDFIGYRHNAMPPLHDFMSDKPIYYSEGGLKDTRVTIGAGFNVQDNNLGASLSLADLGNGGYFTDYYFGVAVRRTDDTIVSGVVNYHGVKTTDKKIGANGFIPSVNIPLGPTGTSEAYLPINSRTYEAVGFLTPVQLSSYTLMANAGSLAADNVFPISLQSYQFSITGGNEWLSIKFLQVDGYNNNPLTGTLRFMTYRDRGTGNYNSGNTVRVYLAHLEGRFGSSGPGIDPPQVGEPEINFPPGNSSISYIDIPCKTAGSTNPGYYDLAFSLPNESGTGATQYPLRWVLAQATVYHSGANPDGSWNNTSGNKEVATANRELQSTSTS